MSTLAELFFEKSGVASETVEVAGLTFEVRSMDLSARNQMLADVTDPSGKVDNSRFYVRVVVATCFDPESGEPVFTPGDAERLQKARADVVDELASVGMRLSGLTEKAVDESGKPS